MRFEQLPRARLANLPTPLEELTRLRSVIGGPRLFLKRDDLTGMAMGGNKLRKLEYLMGDALARGADTIITSGAAQTNHGRLTAAAAAKLGLKCILVVTGEEPAEYEGNMLLYQALGAELRYATIAASVPAKDRAKEYLRAGDQVIEEIVASLKREGRKPYVIPRGGRSLQGTAGYILAAIELYSQLIERGIKADYFVLPAATCSTMTGLLLGSRILSLDTKVLGLTVSRSAAEGKQMVAEEFTKDAATLGYDFAVKPDEVNIDGSYLGEGYGIPNEATFQAISLVAQHEAVLLDPVYTGKAMAGVIDLIRRGFFKSNETVVFFHTGGLPGLFVHEYQQNS